MPIYMNGQEYQDESALEAAFNPAIPESLKRIYITKEDPAVKKPTEDGDYNMVVDPTVMQLNKELDKIEIDPTTGLGLDINYRMPLESPTEPADAFKSDPGTPVAPEIKTSPEPSQEVDWSKLNQPTGSVEMTDVGDSPLAREIEDFKKRAAEPTVSLKDTSDEDIQTAINVAMGAGPGTIGGVLARTAKLGKLGTGMDYTDPVVTAKTGWWKGFDGKIRFEISDEGMKLADRDWTYGQTGKLSEFVEHPELYKAYPELKDINFKVAEKDYKYIGSYNAESKTLTINPNAVKAGDEGILDVLAHEIQHIIQVKEGFGTGSNPERAIQKVTDALLTKMGSTKDPEVKKELVELYIDLTSNKDFADYMYLRTPGEVEANIVAARRKLSDKLRKEFPVEEHKKLVEGEVNTLHGGKYLPEFNYPKVP